MARRAPSPPPRTGATQSIAPDGAGPLPVLMGFHGYAESAAVHLPLLARLDPGHEWLRVSVQGLHRFYARGRPTVVASWMTREDREHAIADNVAYAAGGAAPPWRRDHATRVAAGGWWASRRASRRRIASPGGRAAPAPASSRSAATAAGCRRRRAGLPPVLIGRGTRDSGTRAEKLAADVGEPARGRRRRDRVCEFEGGHEWGDAVRGGRGGIAGGASSGAVAAPEPAGRQTPQRRARPALRR